LPIALRLRLPNPWRGLGGLPADVWIIFATSLVNRAGMMALPFLVLYLTQYLHVPAHVAGLAISAYGIGGMIGAPIAGRLCDRVGAFTVMRASLVLTGVVLLVIPLAHRFAAVAVLTFVWGIVADSTRPATMSALTNATPAERRKAAIALNRLAVNLGMSIGPAIGGFLALVSFPLLFVVDGGTSVLAALVLSVLLASRRSASARPERVPAPPVASLQRSREHSGGVWRDRPALLLLLGLFLVSLIFLQNEGALPLYVVRDLHHRASTVGLIFVINTLLIVTTEVPLNLAMHGWPHRRALVLGALFTAVGFGALGLVHGTVAIASTVVVWTIGEMITFPVGGAQMADLAPPGRSGEYMGVYSSTFSLAMVVGPWAGTAALDRFGGGVTWAGVCACGLIAATVIGTTGGRQPGAADPPDAADAAVATSVEAPPIAVE
jgi:MFS family permease